MLLQTVLVVGACGGDDDDDDGTTTPDGGGKDSGTGGNIDAGGGIDGGNDAGTGGDAGGADASVVTCGTQTCASFPAFGPLPATTPCCATSGSAQVCSAISALTGMCGAAATLDSRCPDVTINFPAPTGAIVSKGCCTANNQCGVDSTQIGFGCSDLSSPQTRGLLMNLVTNLPEGRTCSQ